MWGNAKLSLEVLQWWWLSSLHFKWFDKILFNGTGRVQENEKSKKWTVMLFSECSVQCWLLWGLITWGSWEFWRSDLQLPEEASPAWANLSKMEQFISGDNSNCKICVKGRKKTRFFFVLNTSSVYHAVQIMWSPGSRHWFLSALGSVCCGARPAATFASHEVQIGLSQFSIATIIAYKTLWAESWSISLFFSSEVLVGFPKTERLYLGCSFPGSQ